MTPARFDAATLRREALVARAALQRIELTSTVAQLRHRSLATRSLAALALRAASGLANAPRTPLGAPRARPWLASGGWLLWRALRASPAARWVVGAVALGAAAWWVTRALRTPDDTPLGAAGETSGESADAGG